jgi:hypothetical protein
MLPKESGLTPTSYSRSAMSIGKGAAFRVLRCFNDPALSRLAGSHGRIDERTVALFPKPTMTRRVLGALAKEGLIPLKEVCESFEFFEHVRKGVRAPVVADLAAGHGFTGLLFAIFEREVEQVILVDTNPPTSHQRILEALVQVAPWIEEKVRWVTGSIDDASEYLEAGTSIVAVHACGVRTDACLDVALSCRGHVAVMPCCYGKTGGDAPQGLRDALGVDLTADIERTYRLEAAGYSVRWSNIPHVITPMHRILMGRCPAS